MAGFTSTLDLAFTLKGNGGSYYMKTGVTAIVKVKTELIHGTVIGAEIGYKKQLCYHSPVYDGMPTSGLVRDDMANFIDVNSNFEVKYLVILVQALGAAPYLRKIDVDDIDSIVGTYVDPNDNVTKSVDMESLSITEAIAEAQEAGSGNITLVLNNGETIENVNLNQEVNVTLAGVNADKAQNFKQGVQ